jgi:hypothetical protein
MTLEIRDFEPSRIIDYVCSFVAETVANKDLELMARLEETPPVLQGDEVRSRICRGRQKSGEHLNYIGALRYKTTDRGALIKKEVLL